MIRISLHATLRIGVGEQTVRRTPEPCETRAPSSSRVRPPEALVFSAKPDRHFVSELQSHLSPLLQSGALTLWHEGAVSPGDDVQARLQAVAQTACLFVPLLSADFFASGAASRNAMTTALTRHHAGHARLIPVIVRPCDLQGTPFATAAPLPRGAIPITAWPSRDEAWTTVVESLRTLLDSSSYQPACKSRIQRGDFS